MVVSNGKSKMNAPVLRRLRKSSSTVGSVPTFKIVVFGQSGVGKTAMSVRFVTKRFIGEYDPTLDDLSIEINKYSWTYSLLYTGTRHGITMVPILSLDSKPHTKDEAQNIYQYYHGVGGSCVLFEIMDTAGQEENDLMMEEKIRWADAFILVYAINDQTSFDEITRLKFTISHTMTRLSHQHKQVHPEPIVTIVGNKTDLEPDRMVGLPEGENLARSMNCAFHEISVRDGLSEVMEVFEDTYLEYKNRMSMYHSMNDISGSITRKKSKSFKYVDRIPRMQGKRRNYASVVDISSDIMMSKIDEDSETPETFRPIPKTNGYHHQQRASLPVDNTPSMTSSQNDVRPPGRSRRNAVIGLGNGLPPPVQNGDAANHDDDHASKRRERLVKAARHSDNSIHSSFRDVRPRHLRRYDTNNNTAELPKASRRCRSQENIDINSHSMLENFNKRAVSFDVTNGLSKRVS